MTAKEYAAKIKVLQVTIAQLEAADKRLHARIADLRKSLDRQAKDIIALKERNRKVIAARNEAIANRSDALEEVKTLQEALAEKHAELTAEKERNA